MADPVFLRKTILWPGTFVDRNGREVSYSPDEVRQASAGTQALMASGYKVQAYPAHGIEDSRTIQGTWIRFWEGHDEDRGPTVEGLIHLMPGCDDPEAVERLKRLDVSAVTAWDYVDGDVEIPICILRADIVGAGAISGLPPFEDVPDLVAAIGLSARTFELSAPVAPRSRKMDLKELLPVMREAMGMEADVSDDEAVTQMSALLASYSGEDEPEAPEPDEEDAEKPDEEEDEEKLDLPPPPPPAEMSAGERAALARIAKLEKATFEAAVTSRLAALSSPIPKDRVSKAFRRYDELSPRLGHDYAMSVSIELLDEAVNGARRVAELSNAMPGPRKTQTPKKPRDKSFVDYCAKKWARERSDG